MSIPFEIPAKLAARYVAGDLVRNGAILREVSSGRIVAHLQETGALQRLLTSGMNPLQFAADGVQMYQNEQIKAGLAVIQHLQVANLALTGIGIGVSVAGFAILAQKIKRIEADLGRLQAAIVRLTRKVDRLQDHLIRQELGDLRAELRRIDEAWTHSDAASQWRLAADRLLTLEERFHGHARALIDAREEPALRDLMIEAFSLASAARPRALLASGEDEAAEVAARAMAVTLIDLTGGVGAANLLREMIAGELAATGTSGRGSNEGRLQAIERLRPEAAAKACALREREDAAACAPITIAALRSSGISGREWLDRARSETTAPLICLPVEQVLDVV